MSIMFVRPTSVAEVTEDCEKTFADALKNGNAGYLRCLYGGMHGFIGEEPALLLMLMFFFKVIEERKWLLFAYMNAENDLPKFAQVMADAKAKRADGSHGGRRLDPIWQSIASTYRGIVLELAEILAQLVTAPNRVAATRNCLVPLATSTEQFSYELDALEAIFPRTKAGLIHFNAYLGLLRAEFEANLRQQAAGVEGQEPGLQAE